VQPSLNIASAKAFVDLVKTTKQEMVFGSSGNGSVQHLSGEMFKRRAGIDFLHVPLAGGGPLQKAFLQGELQVIFETGANVVPNYQAGKMKALAVMADERLIVMPEVPTMAEAGYPDMRSEAWFGFLAPRGTPDAVVQRLHAVISDALQQPEVRNPLIGLGTRLIDGGPAAFAAFIAEEDRRLGKLVKEVGVKPD
jgi:tripartite-type tricarboxylate transporter receptor subunit TctC